MEPAKNARNFENQSTNCFYVRFSVNLSLFPRQNGIDLRFFLKACLTVGAGVSYKPVIDGVAADIDRRDADASSL
jgi:hypothetical protein